MREKENINLKNKINFKNLLVKKTQQSLNPQSINIQTIRKDKFENFFYDDKRFIKTKLSNNIRYINNTITNNNINNNYLLNDDQASYFSFYNSNKEPSPINSLNSSFNSTYTQKKNKYKRLQKRNNHKYNNFNINSSNSINNLSLNSRIINTNQSVSLNSSSYSYNECSDSSDFSYRSRENKKKKYKELMMAEDDDLDYLKRKEVGLVSSDEEENNNSIDNNNASEENYNNEIERILIEIYNKNISLISSGNYSEIEKNKCEIEEIEKQIKKYLKKKNFRTNLLVLKCLSKKIKDLVEKYKEKVFEIEEIKTIYDIYKKRLIQFNNQISHNNNSVGSNVATNSNSSYDSNLNDEEILIKNNNSLLNIQDEIKGKGITNILLRELINIKKTLKISSKEIESIFKYPLNLLKNENGKKIKFSVELMQSEEFCKTLLNDEFIYTLLSQMKGIFTQISIPNITQWIEEVLEDCDHKNEMTRFVKYINEKLGITNENNDNNKNEINNYLDEYNKIKENSNNNNLLEEQIGKNTAFSLDTGSSNEGILFKNDKIIKNKSSNESEDYNKTNNSNSNKKSKKKKQKKNNENENKNENNKVNFKDIDELLNYINDETDSKKGKKKSKKCRKNKKQNNINKDKDKENEENNYLKNDENNNVGIDNFEEKKDIEFEQLFNDFKRDIEKDSVYVYDINKIEACLSNDFITNKCNN